MKRCLSTSNVSDVTNDTNDSNESFVTKLSKKAKKQTKVLISATQPSTSSHSHDQSSMNIDDIINYVASTGGDQPVVKTASTLCDNCSGVCNELKCKVDNQQLIIDKLVCQLNFVLSFLNITDNVETSAIEQRMQILVSPKTSSSFNPSAPLNAVSTEVNPGLPISWSDIVVNGSNGPPILRTKSAKPAKLEDAIMSAVYTDKLEKERRSNSFIVSGLRVRNGITDKDAICQLCTDEFGISPTVIFSKRLGEERINTTQPLLVAVNSTEQAAEIISCAKSLRRSTDRTVKDNVYINHNLTKAEAHTAYLKRCRRREQTTKRLQVNLTVDDNATMDTNGPTAAGSAGSASAASSNHSNNSFRTRIFNNSQQRNHHCAVQNSTNVNQLCATPITSSNSSLMANNPNNTVGTSIAQLNASVPEFVPVPSTSSQS
jgi:hypothetical protein